MADRDGNDTVKGGPRSGASHRPRRVRVLFVAEAVTLAHVARVHALAQQLDQRYEVCIAADPRYNGLVGAHRFRTCDIDSITPGQFTAALASGSPAYDMATLERYVEADQLAIDACDPDVVIGDFRLSLGVAARLAGKPCITIANAGWSPFASTRFVVPDLPFVRWVGVTVAQRLFDIGRPFAFRVHASPLNRIRMRHGLPSLGADIRETYTDGDQVLYADIPELFPVRMLPSSHRFMGAVLWEPSGELPTWWASLPRDRPIVYVTLGSSGDTAMLDVVLAGLSSLPIYVVAATAGRSKADRIPENAYIADFLPGSTICRSAAMVVCNGGSPTCYQALSNGIPVLGIPSNLDQFINMTAVADAGAGSLLRTSRTSPGTIAFHVGRILDNLAVRQAAERLRQSIDRYRPGEVLGETIERAVNPSLDEVSSDRA